MSLAAIDIAGFRAVNGMAGRWVVLDAIGIFGATYLIFVLIALGIAYVAVSWKTPHFEGRFENLWQAVWAAVIGFICENVIGWIWFRPRPFVALDHVMKLIAKSPLEHSFPSGHTTASFAIAFAVWFHNKEWGGAFLAAAAVIAVSRIYVGVHYPADIAGGIVLGFLSALAAAPLKKAVEPYLDLFAVFRNNKGLDS